MQMPTLGAVELMKVLARACGHDRLSGFNMDDLITWKRDMADLAGVAYGGAATQITSLRVDSELLE